MVYLGHIVGGGGLKINPYKVKIIVNQYKLKNVTEVRSFLGVAQHWRMFIIGFSSFATLLHALTSVKQGFQWGIKQQKAFDVLKENISTTPVLALLDLKQPLKIQTDASDYVMGGSVDAS